MTDTNPAPTKKDVLAAFNAVEVTTTPPTKAEVERARRTLAAEEAFVALRDTIVELGIDDGDLGKALRAAGSFTTARKNVLATIESIPDTVLDPEAAPKAPRKPRETKTATLSDADKVAAARRHADQTTEDAIALAQADADLEAEEAAIKERTDAKNGDVDAPTEVQEAIALPAATRVAPQRPPLSRPIPADAPNTDADPRGATDPNADDEGF